jgi:hypothetical protein
MAKSCYDCSHCEPCAEGVYGREGVHACRAPVPAWEHDCCNEASNLIEAPFHDHTMADECAVFTPKIEETS